METFNLGDIVALNSHPYTSNLTSIVISGEPQFVSPLMVVTEILLETANKFDEKTGDEISTKGNSQCKCVWYSSKAHQFEETWISSTLLKHIKYEPDQSKFILEESSKKEIINKLVILKTSDIELGKQKSSVSIEANSINSPKDKNTINALLSFVAPVMQVIQAVEVKSIEKEPVYDAKTGTKKRINTKWLVKCKWYNPADKLSEKLLPLECLNILPDIKKDLLEEITDKIENLGFYEVDGSLIQPKNLLYVNGYYYLKAYDYIKNKTIDIKIELKTIFKNISSYYNLKVPVFEFKNGEKLPENYFNSNLLLAINTGLKNTHFLRIYYTNRLNVASYRTIKNYEVVNIEEGEENITYLKGYCMTKSDYRYFRLERIQELQILNMKY
ncbi:MAG: hypothetical protein JWQ79_2182 [Mucilaginibacter sp.]|nr:hypothetical protein [Mucilaginibacter sp.]